MKPVAVPRLPFHLFLCPVCGQPFKTENVCHFSDELVYVVCRKFQDLQRYTII